VFVMMYMRFKTNVLLFDSNKSASTWDHNAFKVLSITSSFGQSVLNVLVHQS
jgi:hypothetical protein